MAQSPYTGRSIHANLRRPTREAEALPHKREVNQKSAVYSLCAEIGHQGGAHLLTLPTTQVTTLCRLVEEEKMVGLIDKGSES